MPARTLAWHADPEGGVEWVEEEEGRTLGKRVGWCRDGSVFLFVKGSEGETLL